LCFIFGMATACLGTASLIGIILPILFLIVVAMDVADIIRQKKAKENKRI